MPGRAKRLAPGASAPPARTRLAAPAADRARSPSHGRDDGSPLAPRSHRASSHHRDDGSAFLEGEPITVTTWAYAPSEPCRAAAAGCRPGRDAKRKVHHVTTEASDLARLARPFPRELVQRDPGGNSYVAHENVTQWLLGIVGPFSFELAEIIRGELEAERPDDAQQPLGHVLVGDVAVQRDRRRRLAAHACGRRPHGPAGRS